VRVNETSQHPLEYFGVPPRPRRLIPPLDSQARRHLLAMITTAIAALAMGLISFAMLQEMF
jgi:hypothetical protein